MNSAHGIPYESQAPGTENEDLLLCDKPMI